MNNIGKKIIAVLFLLIAYNTYSQHTENLINLNELKFTGNEKTKTSYLVNILDINLDEPYTFSQIETKLQSLKNLASVVDASYEIKLEADNNILIFHIIERRTKLPILNLGGIKNNLWFGVGIIENNLNGTLDQLLTYYQNTDMRHSFEVFYKRPRPQTKKLGYSLSLRKWSSNEPLYFNEGPVQYLYDNYSVAGSIIKYFSLRNSIELGANFFRERYRQSENQTLLNPPGPDQLSLNKYLTKFNFNTNYLDYSFFSVNGYSFSLVAQNVFNFDDSSFFNSLIIEAKYFLKLTEKTNIGSRLTLGIATNNDSPFAPFVADSYVNIRGIGNRIDRGTAQAVMNLEIRQTLFHFQNWASQFVAFSDLGTWRNPGGGFDDLIDQQNFREFVGAGLRINYQKVFGATLRIDYSIDLSNTQDRGFVIGLGQYF